jgi:hypothetical protein
MEIRKDEEEEEKEEKDEEKEEEIEEEEKEEEKEDSKEEDKKPQKVDPPKNLNQNQEEDDKQPPNYKEQSPIQKKKKEEIDLKENNEEQIENIENKNNPENQEQDLEATSTYILKYTRKGDELKELAVETGLRKSENCLFMLNIKLIKSDSISIIEQDEENKEKEKETPKEPENFLVFCCHEIAAIYFDEIYERIYTLKDLANENKYFKVFESTEEAKIVIDETIRTNEKNAKKIFIGFKDKELKLHMKLSFFDKEKEIVLNIPKKPLSDEDKINLLPEFLKEIQDKMNHLNDENKKLKAKKLAFGNRGKDNKYNYKNNIVNESIEIAKEKKDKNTNMSFEHNEVQFNEFKAEEININPDNNTKNNDVINNTVNVGSGNNVVHKKVKKLKVIKKKQSKPEENFF